MNPRYYRIGWDLDVNGNIAGGWSKVKPVPGWSAPLRLLVPDQVGWETQGAAVATGYITGQNRPDLVVFYIDNPTGENGGYYFLSEILVGVP